MEKKDYEDVEVSKNEERLVEQVDTLKKQIQKMEKKINSLIAKKTIKKEKQENKEKKEEKNLPLDDSSSVNDELVNENVENTNEASSNDNVTVIPSLDSNPVTNDEPVIFNIDEEKGSFDTIEEKPIDKNEVEDSSDDVFNGSFVMPDLADEEQVEEVNNDESVEASEEDTDDASYNEEDKDDVFGGSFAMPDLTDEEQVDEVNNEEAVEASEEDTDDSSYTEEDKDDVFNGSFVMPDLSDENNVSETQNEEIDEVTEEKDGNKDIESEPYGLNDFEDDLVGNNVVEEEESFLNVPSNDFDEVVVSPVTNKKEASKVIEPVKQENIKNDVYDFEMPNFDIPTEEIKLNDENDAKRKAEEYEKTIASWSSVESSVSVIEVPKVEEKDELDYFTSQKVERQNKVEYVVNEAPKPVDVPTFDDIDFDGVDFDAPVFNEPKTELDLIANMNAEELKIYKKRRKEEQKANKQRLIKEQKEIQKTRKQDAKYSGKDKRNPVVKALTIFFVIIFVVVLFIVVYGSFGICDLLPKETYFKVINLQDFYEWLIVDTINPVCNKMGFDIITDFFEKIRDLLGK